MAVKLNALRSMGVHLSIEGKRERERERGGGGERERLGFTVDEVVEVAVKLNALRSMGVHLSIEGEREREREREKKEREGEIRSAYRYDARHDTRDTVLNLI